MNMRIARRVLLAGLAGGMAEILWVALYAATTPLSGVVVAREVAATVLPWASDLVLAPVLGVAVHLALSLVLGLAFAWAVWLPFARRLAFPAAMATAVAALAGVWVVNFLVVLPVLNPAFVMLMPYGASLTSKLLFGAAMAWTLAERRGPWTIGARPGMADWSISSRH